MSIKSTLITIATVSIAFVSGCKTTPTTESMSNLGAASGYTAAYVLNNQVKPDTETRDTIIKVMYEVEKYIPGTNETFATAWTPIVKDYLDELKDKDGNPLPDTTKERVIKDFGYIIGLLDNYIEKKGIKQYQDLVDAFINSFIDSFLRNFKPSNILSETLKVPLYDSYTEIYLMSEIKK